MFIDELANLPLEPVARSFALWLNDEFRKRPDISGYHQDKIKISLLAVARAPKESWFDTMKIEFYRITAPIVESEGLKRRKWQYGVLESNDNNFITHVLGFLDNIKLIEDQKLYDRYAEEWRDKYLPLDHQTSRMKNLLRQYVSRGEEFIESNCEHAKRNAKTNLFSYLATSLREDHGKDLREIKRKRDEANNKEALKRYAVYQERDRIQEMVAKVKELPEDVYGPLYKRAKAYLIDKTKGAMPETFLQDWSIELIMSEFIRQEKEENENNTNAESED